ncbi:MAG: hypothetical protein IJA90_07085 [Peptococcaceae bacterium]|nr:hypothetical protein [Peptococcaceae bacterium]
MLEELSWIVIVAGFLLVIAVIVLAVFGASYKNKELGNAFMKKSEKPFKRTAPSIYYDKQMIFRKCYGFFIGVHTLLVILSTVLTIITIYMVMDTQLALNIRITVGVLAAASANLQISLRYDKVAEAYIQAMRILEQAILEYEQTENASYQILLDANRRAEEVIQNRHH